MTAEATSEFGTRKMIVVFAIVGGCFAVLFPKIFYPMLTTSLSPPPTADSSGTIKQERQTPPHAGSYHPAMREKGRAIPSSHIVPRIQERPDQMTPMKMRPPMGGAGHVVAAPKGTGSLGLLMPLYTIGIVLFFLYTMSKVLIRIFMPIYTIGNVVSLLYKVLQVLRKSSDSEILRPEYSMAGVEKEYQNLVFNPELFATAVTAISGQQTERIERPPTPKDESTPTIDELKEHQAPKSNGLAAGASPNPKESSILDGTLDQDEEELEEIHESSPTMKVLNMEMTASCEGGQKCSRPTTPVLLTSHSHTKEREKSPPISIYLEGALPPQCELLVTDSKTQEIQEEENVELPIVLSGKMTLSLISLDQLAAESQENEHFEIEAAQRQRQDHETDSSSECDESEPEDFHGILSNRDKRTMRVDEAEEDAEDEEEAEDEESYESDSQNDEENDELIDECVNRSKVILKQKINDKNYDSYDEDHENDTYSNNDDDSNKEDLQPTPRTGYFPAINKENRKKTDDEIDEEARREEVSEEEEDEEEEEEEEEKEEEEEEDEEEEDEEDEDEDEDDEVENVDKDLGHGANNRTIKTKKPIVVENRH